MMERNLAGAVGIVVVLAAVASFGADAATQESSKAPDPVVARVEGQAIRASELNDRTERVERVYRERTGHPIPQGYDAFFRRSALEELVHDRLMGLDAMAKGVAVSDASAESLLQADKTFNAGGRFDAAGYTRYKAQNPIGFRAVLRQAREALTAQRHGQDVERSLDLAPADLDRLWRMRYGRAHAQAVLLPALELGFVAEPSDDEVRADYARHAADFIWPAELDYTILSFVMPSLSDADRRARLDGVLAESRAGASFDTLARRYAGRMTRQTWREGQDAAGFEGHPDLMAEALAARAGTVLTEAITSAEGFYLVRVDRSRSRGPAPLMRIAGEVRSRLAADRLAAERSAQARAAFDANPKAYVLPAWQVRWAFVDSARVEPPAPSQSELAAWYDSHQAEFARVDPAGGGIRVAPLSAVHAEAMARLRTERRAGEARRLADAWANAWAAGKSPPRDRAVTAGGPAWIVRGGTRPEGLDVALADSARSWTTAGHVLVVANARGFQVLHLMRVDANYPTPYALAEPRILEQLAQRRASEDSARVRSWFADHRERFRSGRGYVLSITEISFPPPAGVDVPESAIERYYRERPDEVGTPEQVHVRHILVRPEGRTSAQAEARARSLLARLAGGEDFATVARLESDDPLTRDKGGDVGFVQRGQAPPPFESAAFALSAAHPLSDVVRTEIGYHILHFEERQAARMPALSDARLDIGRKLAVQYADSLARQLGERLRDTSRNPQEFYASAEREGLHPYHDTWYEGMPEAGPLIVPELRAELANSSAGQVLRTVPHYAVAGYIATAVDSVLPPRLLEFEEAEERVRDDWSRARAAARGPLRADRLEHDLASGMNWDTAIACAGNASDPFTVGFRDAGPAIPSVPGLDSLLFGPGDGVLAAGAWTRKTVPDGDWFVRKIESIPPDAATAGADRGRLRAVVLNRRLYDYDEELRKRFTVTVLDEALRERLPPPPSLP